MITILCVFLICFSASVVGGICGVGGGIVIKPLLDATGWMSVSAVSFLSGCTVWSMAVMNLFRSRDRGELEPESAVPLGIGAAVGGVTGGSLFSVLQTALRNDRMVGSVQAAVLGAVLLATLVYIVRQSHIRTKPVKGKVSAIAIGLLLGMFSAFLGIGGGPVNLVVLHYFFSMETKKAAPNSILVILFSQTASILLRVATGSVPLFDIRFLIVMIAAGLSGGFLSAELRKTISGKAGKHLLEGFILLTFAICVYNIIRFR